MASRRDYYYRELVTEAELDAGFEGLEDADRAMVTDLAVVGVYTGLGVAQAGAPNLSVDVGGGTSYDQDGQRCRVPATQNVSVATDSNNQPTTVAGVGNERWVSVFLVFDRSLSDQRTDGNSNTVFFVRDESFKFTVVQGAEAPLGTATRPGLLASGILLADVKLVHNQTQVLNADVSVTRRQWAFAISGAPQSLARGQAKEVFTDLLTYYNNHVTGVADVHPASSLSYAGGGNWADGTTNPATTVEGQFDKMLTDLGSGTGTAKVGGSGFSVGAATVSAGTLLSQLQLLATAAAHNYAGGGSWLDASPNPQTTVEAQLDKLITDLTSTSGGGGAGKTGCGARTAWLGGRVNPAISIFGALDKIITDLASTAVSDDGAERIGFNASGNLSATDVGAAIRELDAEKGGLALANVWTSAGSNTFQGPVVMSGSAGTFAWRTQTVVADANTTLDVSADVWKQASAQAASRQHTLRHSTSPIPTNGQRLRYIRPKTTTGFYPITLVREDLTVLCVAPPGDYAEVEFYYQGAWTVADHTSNVLTGE